MKIIPRWDKVLMELVEAGVSPGGIIIPSTVKGKTTAMYRVLSLGEGPLRGDGTFMEHRIKVGDLVLVQQGSRIEIEGPGGMKQFLCREVDCIAVVEM